MSTIGISNILFRDFEQEDRSNVACFAVGCSLTFVGVKLLTSRRDRSRSASHSHRGGGGSGRDDASLADPRSPSPCRKSPLGRSPRGATACRSPEASSAAGALGARLLGNEYPGAANALPSDPSLDRLYPFVSTPPRRGGGGGGCGGGGGGGGAIGGRDAAAGAARDDDDGFDGFDDDGWREREDSEEGTMLPLTLLNTPLGTSTHDFLRRSLMPRLGSSGSVDDSEVVEQQAARARGGAAAHPQRNAFGTPVTATSQPRGGVREL